jgi:SpoVK/Ycf46/Vps4 family AAA+-type ATPase
MEAPMTDDHHALEHLMFRANAAFMALESSNLAAGKYSSDILVDAEFALFDLCALLQCMGLESEPALWQTSPLLESCLSKIQYLRKKKRQALVRAEDGQPVDNQPVSQPGGAHPKPSCLLSRMQSDPVLSQLLKLSQSLCGHHPTNVQRLDVLLPSTGLVLNGGTSEVGLAAQSHLNCDISAHERRDLDPLENTPPKEIDAKKADSDGDDPKFSAQKKKLQEQTLRRKRRSPAEKSENGFQTAKAKLIADGVTRPPPPPPTKRASGAPISRSPPPLVNKHPQHQSGPAPSGKFVPPFVKKALQATTGNGGGACHNQSSGIGAPQKEGPLSARTLQFLGLNPDDTELPEELAKLDAQLIEQICNEVIHGRQDVTWDDIAGQETAKRLIQEIVVWPMLNPHIFRGARAPPRGLLLFGPPGTGKTLLGRAIASNIKAAFFSISASSLTSKWIGEGEKLVRTLFTVARRVSPAVIFIDEIDSILSARRSDGEHEASRRLKTEMLVQMEGVGVEEKAHNSVMLLIGATNRPEELDEAARRRLPKQLYIPLPCPEARRQMIQRQLSQINYNLSVEDLDKIVLRTEGYSGSDMKNLIQEACQGPVRDAVRKVQLSNAGNDASLGSEVSQISLLQENDLRAVNLRDFAIAARAQRASVEAKEIVRYEEYNAKHGAKFISLSDEEMDEGSDMW